MSSQLEQMNIMAQALMNSGFDMFEITKAHCEEKKHLPLAKARDRPGTPWCNFMCAGCMEAADNPTEFLQCSKCKAVKYCSKDCQLRDWVGRSKGPTQPRAHKDLCHELLQANQEFQNSPDCGENLRKTLFSSWADQHCKDGSFFDSEFKARREILGRLEVGFWAQPCTNGAPYLLTEADASGFQNGQMLLAESFPTLKVGWKMLQENEYPSTDRPKEDLPPQGIRSWKEYCQWREIKGTSIAPLLLTNILTIYQMIHHDLNLTKNYKNKLTVYLLGVETELNYIPLFGELAFLMPGVDLTLIMVSPGTKAICAKAKEQKFSKSILARGYDSTKHLSTVFDYTDCSRSNGDGGGGRIRIQLASNYGYLHECPPDILASNMPDAFIGLNAGLGTYPSWQPSMMGILETRVPFAFTDHTKLQFRMVEEMWLPSVVQNAMKSGLRIPLPVLTEIKLNPFHGVVNRDIAAVLVPNINNGYILLGNKRN